MALEGLREGLAAKGGSRMDSIDRTDIVSIDFADTTALAFRDQLHCRNGGTTVVC